MANVKISQLPSLTTMTDTAEIPVVSAGVTYQITGANLTNYFGGGNTFSSITMNATPSGPSNVINYGLGNLVVWNDGGWTIGEYNSDTEMYATDGIRINPGIEGPVDITLPSDLLANTQPTSVSNFLGNVVINTGVNYVSHQWKFDNAGALNLPDNGFVQTLNSYPTLLAYGSAGHGGPELDWANTSNLAALGNSSVLRHTMYINDEGLYIGFNENNVANVASPNWNFGPDGNLVLPGTGSVVNQANTSLDPLTPTAATMVLTPDSNYNSQALVLDPTSPGHIHLRSPANGNIDLPYANLYLGGELSSFEVGASYGSTPNVFIHSNGNTWTFDGDGVLTTPGVAGNITGANIISANTFVTPGVTIDSLGQITAAPNNVVSILANGVSGGFLVDYYGNTNADANTSGGEIALNGGPNVELTIGLSSDSGNGSASRVWRYNTAGQTSFPILNTQRGDNPSGTITGYTLLGGTGDYEFVISTPDGITGIDASQRLVINPGAGRAGTAGEGGDIYLWAGRGGDASGSGGDIKIRGGQGGANTSGGTGGDGGYIRMEAGDSSSAGGAAGYIQITAGQSQAGAVGGYIHITGGIGATGGGEANIQGGYADSGPGGAVHIIGGGSSNGLAYYGNVSIAAGASTWTFDNTGTTTFPNGAKLNNGTAYQFATDNTVVTSLDLRDTTGRGFYTNGSGYTLRSNGSYSWVFGTDGNLTTPGSGGDVALTGGNVTGANVITATTFSATANALVSGYAKFSGTFDESQAATAGLYVGYAGGTPRIMFGTGNTLQTFEIDNDAGTLRFYQPGSTKASLTSGGVFTANVVVTTPVALSSLTAVAGARAFINDGNLVAAGNFGAQVAGGSGNTVPVWSDGTNWYIG